MNVSCRNVIVLSISNDITAPIKLPVNRPLIRNRSLTVCSCHVTYSFQSESTLSSCLNVKEHLARNRHEIWSLSVCNGTRTHNHLVCKRTLNHLTKLASLAKCLSIRLRTKWLCVPVQLQSLKRIEVVFHKWSLLYLKI